MKKLPSSAELVYFHTIPSLECAVLFFFFHFSSHKIRLPVNVVMADLYFFFGFFGFLLELFALFRYLLLLLLLLLLLRHWSICVCQHLRCWIHRHELYLGNLTTDSPAPQNTGKFSSSFPMCCCGPCIFCKTLSRFSTYWYIAGQLVLDCHEGWWILDLR